MITHKVETKGRNQCAICIDSPAAAGSKQVDNILGRFRINDKINPVQDRRLDGMINNQTGTEIKAREKQKLKYHEPV
jgi:hypothetical protein